MEARSTFDLIVVDPPSYATSKAGRFTVREGYAELAPLCRDLLKRDGLLLAASNHAGWSWGEFRKALSAFKLVDRILPPPDFPGADYLKAGVFGR